MTLMARALCIITDDTDEDANRVLVLVEDVQHFVTFVDVGLGGRLVLRRVRRVAAGALSFPASIGVRCLSSRAGVKFRFYFDSMVSPLGLAAHRFC